MKTAHLIVVLFFSVSCSADCDSDVQEYMDGLASLKLWALQSLSFLLFIKKLERKIDIFSFSL
jgi:Tfp pilus assembly protein PilP